MKFTLGWLKDYLDTTASVAEIVDALNVIGLEVEGVEDPGKALAPFKVARVIEARPHPNADRLRVCEVETDEGTMQVVCGAPNARTGMYGIFAAPGSHIPGTGLDLKVGSIRGVESAGMLCSERELMISDDHEGIIDLGGEMPIGTPAAVALGLDDPVIDIAVTPNRPDALGVQGIARDLAARGLGRFTPWPVKPVKGTFASPVGVELRLGADDLAACPHFVGRYFRGVANGPSPDWLKRRLKAVGLRPISALVDITNYVNLAFARPLHVFDADKLKGDIHVRLARRGETIVALDGKTYELDETMTAICDDAGVEAIAGVMGGEESGCTEETVNVFLEVAYFDPVRTAATGRKLNIVSDARYRFERGVDPAFVVDGAEIATNLILELCGGEASELVIAGKEATPPASERTFVLRHDRVRTLGGIDVPAKRQREILSALGFALKDRDGDLEAVAPTWRPDIHGEADLVEEICRIVGLDEVPSAAMSRPHAVARPVLSRRQKQVSAARHLLAGRGLSEAVTWSFLSHEAARRFGGGDATLRLVNPISSELTDMRPSLLPNLIAAVGRNVARGFGDVGLFEVGQTYAGDEPEDEGLKAAGVRRGHTGPRHWARPRRPVDVFDAKADALAVLARLDVPVASLQIEAGGPAWYHPGRSGRIKLGPKSVLAEFGELHPAVLAEMDVEGPLVGFEVDLKALPQRRRKGTARAALAACDLMALSRDFAFVVDNDVAAGDIVKAARAADKSLIDDVSVFDVYAGERLPEGKKSVAIEVRLQPLDHTLSEAEIEKVSTAIIDKVTKATGATLRG